MIPSADDILVAWRQMFARRFDVDPEAISVRAIRGAVRAAKQMAKTPDDEPAALFIAFCSRPRAFRNATVAMTRALVAAQAASMGRHLTASPQDFRALCRRFRSASGRKTLAAVRRWLDPYLV